MRTPVFFPDATFGLIKHLDQKDLEHAKVPGIVVNAYHLFKLGKGKLIEKAGGIHAFMNWNGTVITDSGGWQIMSLIHDNPGAGKITDDGPIFFDPDLKQKIFFTPEKSIELQLQLKPDIMICLDNCTRHDVSIQNQKKSVEQTIKWAAQCKKEFEKLNPIIPARPLLFAVIQGGNSKKLRKKCAEGLLKIGFDGFSFGGHPVDAKGKLVTEILKYTADLIPDKFPKYAMGIGKPEDIVKCVKMGYTMFDCVIPTREARHGRLYVYHPETNLSAEESLRGILRSPRKTRLPQNNKKIFYEHLFVNSKLEYDFQPIDPTCDCLACQNYSRAYIYHLFRLREPAALRLATIHNLRFYTRLMEKIS